MADTLVKKPVVIVGTKAQVESTTMGENDFAIATDVEFYNKAETDTLLGGYATKTDLNAKQNKLSATGSSNRPVYYDGNALKETTRLKAELVSGGFAKEVYYAHHPEMGEMHVIPFIYNDFAFIDKKGGSYTVTRNDGGEVTNPQNIFDAAPSFMLSRGFTADTIWTVEISTPTSFSYGTILYIDFGSEGFSCAYIKIEAQNSATGAWQNVLERTDNSFPYVYCRCSSDDAGVNKFRFTFKSPLGANQFRISSIGAISYKSAGVEETLLTRKGGTVYGDVIAPNITKIQNETTSIKNTLNGKVNVAQGAENAGKILKVDDNGNVVVGEGGGASLPILMSMWSDHVINDMSWLRADTFSWQSGDVYKAVYEHLSADLSNVDKLYCWYGDTRFYTKSETPSVGDTVYTNTGSDTGWTIEEIISNSVVLSNGYSGSRDSANDELLSYTDVIDGTTITYYVAQDGHKICLPDQESNLVALYEQTGVAWYYVLDTENKQFKLPRTKWGFTGLRDGVGGYVAPALPNITGKLTTFQDAFGEGKGAFSLQNDGTSSGGAHSTASHTKQNILFDAHSSSPVYQDNATVQPPATQMYLYFYVGNFEPSAIEQTAGITSEQLNQKADLDLGNLTLEAKSAVVAMGMPDYSAGVYISNATIKAGFTAPSSGYLVSTAGWATLTINGNSLPNGAFTFANNASSLQQIFIPLDSGDVVVGTGAYITDSSRFFPAKGVQ